MMEDWEKIKKLLTYVRDQAKLEKIMAEEAKKLNLDEANFTMKATKLLDEIGDI